MALPLQVLLPAFFPLHTGSSQSCSRCLKARKNQVMQPREGKNDLHLVLAVCFRRQHDAFWCLRTAWGCPRPSHGRLSGMWYCASRRQEKPENNIEAHKDLADPVWDRPDILPLYFGGIGVYNTDAKRGDQKPPTT